MWFHNMKWLKSISRCFQDAEGYIAETPHAVPLSRHLQMNFGPAGTVADLFHCWMFCVQGAYHGGQHY